MTIEELLTSGIFTDVAVFPGGFNFAVSDSECFDIQVNEGEAFLETNSKVCKELAEKLKPEVPVLDFGLWKKEGPVQSVTFPGPLVKLAGRLGFELCATMYEANDL